MRIESEVGRISQMPKSSARKLDQPGFGELIKSALVSVNDQLNQAEQAGLLLAKGEIDIHNAVIIAEKANLALQLTIAIRKKIIEAYQEIMRMQV
ncbi:MAG TPA: flagellar hook-basal body complex protein FliE [Limnochordia bacterium]|nr:flagellar hook-basal body complex protein FliE [Bacillota bacterium]HKM17593.1 flagellar hook-basal body complex protein FliE [Limnochordia bacterium]